LLNKIDPQFHERIMNIGIDVLEGKNNVVRSEVKSICESCLGVIQPSAIDRLALSIATLQWECAKSSAKDIKTLQDTLSLLGLQQNIITSFTNVFHLHRPRIASLKGSLGISCFSYKSLAWRLEVELASRNCQSRLTPRYLLRLDLTDHTLKQQDPRKERSFHLQASHGALKGILVELQRAADEMQGMHCQRIQRYLS